MTADRIRTTLSDAMYAMSLATRAPDAELLDEFVRRYPEHAQALTNFAIEITLDTLQHGDEPVEATADPENISPVVSRVMSRFQNRLFEIVQKPAPPQSANVAVAPAANPFALLDRHSYRVLASRLDINTAMLSKLRDRQIEPITIPRSFCQHVADVMDQDTDVLSTHFHAAPDPAPQPQYYKAEGKPTTHTRQSFEEAVRGSGLSAEQQQRLLAFRG
jgi:hypothetical protein